MRRKLRCLSKAVTQLGLFLVSNHLRKTFSSLVTTMQEDLSSLESTASVHEHPVERVGTTSLSLAEKVLTRTSTIINDIREDNRAAIQQEKCRMYPLELDDIEDDDAEHSSDSESKFGDDGVTNSHDIINKPPDGGFWAWTTCVCVMLINAFSWGANSAFGVYLNFYMTNDYFPGATMKEYVTIPGLLLGFSFMICTVSNTLIQRWNYKIIMLIGTAIIFLAFWLASIAKTILQLIIFQGLILSIGYGLAAGACFVIIPMWFLKKRSVAQGIAASGAGVGGIVFARPVQVIIEKYDEDGVKWALRMQGLVCGLMLVLSIALMKTCRSLIDPKLGTKEKPIWKEITSFLFRWDLYKQVPMACLLLWNIIYGLGYTIFLFSFSSYATAVGLTYLQGSNVVTVQSVAQLVGRPILGLISDRIGRINATIGFSFFLSIIALAWWIFIRNYAELLVFAFIVGFIMGINWVNFGPLIADYCGGGSKDSIHAMSMLTFSGGFPLIVSELIGLQLRRPEMAKPFLYCQIFVGVSILVSVIILLPFREWKVKRVLHSSWEKSEDQRPRLDKLLDDSWKSYFIRMFYPICV